MQTTRIKICGLRTPEDVRVVNRFLPDFAGFILSPGFRRSVSRKAMRELAPCVRPEIRRVGVFVDAPLEEAASWAEEGLIDLIQLHGSETEAYIRTLREKTGLRIIRAFRIRGEEDIRAAAQSGADFVLLDSGQGSGRTFDWNLIRSIRRPYFLAGGLSTGNVGEAALRFHPYAVDISSGVETEGHKDADKVRMCIEAVRNGTRAGG